MNRRCKGGIPGPLQIDGDALSCRHVVRFDSNTPHDDPHSLAHLSLRSLASADRQGCSSSSTRAPQMWLKVDGRARLSSHPLEVEKCRVSVGQILCSISLLVSRVTLFHVQIIQIRISQHPPPVGPAALASSVEIAVWNRSAAVRGGQ